MFESKPRYVGTSYTATVACLIAALFFAPMVLIANRPFGYTSFTLALLGSLAFVGLAQLSWKRSELTIPTIAPPIAGAK